MAYTDVPMRATATVTPSTSNGSAPPSGSASNRHTTCSAIEAHPQLGADDIGHVGAQALRQALDDLAEEPQHDQAVRHIGRDAAALEVEPLVGVDRPGRRRARAAEVV